MGKHIASLAKQLKSYRKRNKLSQDDIAVQIGWTRLRYNKLETGKKINLSLTELDEVASVIGLRLVAVEALRDLH